MMLLVLPFSFFFFNDTATTEIYTLSLHDALPIFHDRAGHHRAQTGRGSSFQNEPTVDRRDRKSTRLNSSHGYISYAVFCLKKKKNKFDAMSSIPLAEHLSLATVTLLTDQATRPPL